MFLDQSLDEFALGFIRAISFKPITHAAFPLNLPLFTGTVAGHALGNIEFELFGVFSHRF